MIRQEQAEKAMTVSPLTTDIERVLIGGDLAALTPDQRIAYYRRVCDSLGINWLTQPFGYIELWNSQLKRKVLTLYAKKDAAEQLRNLHKVSIPKLDHETVDDMYVVTAYARDEQGREDSDVGVVPLTGLIGNDRANAMLKAVTKAKRRVTLSLCGLGFLDETEVEAVRDAKTVEVSPDGEIVGTETLRYEPHEEAQPEPAKATASDFGKFVHDNNVDAKTAAAVRTAYTVGGVTDWQGAINELKAKR